MQGGQGVKVLVARPGDAEAILDIYNHYVVNSCATFEVEPVSVIDRCAWFEEHSGPGRYRLVVAAGAGGKILGWASTSRFRPRAGYDTTVEASVYCRPETQGQGLGSLLYRRLFHLISREDLERIVAGVALPNPSSVRLHERFGFRPVGVFSSIGRKFGRFIDVAWFERPLRWPPSPAFSALAACSAVPCPPRAMASTSRRAHQALPLRSTPTGSQAAQEP